MFSVRVNRPEFRAARWWNTAQGALQLALPTLIVLKLTGVITWSWWWVLSPIWISGILLVLAVIGLYWYARGQARLWLDYLWSEVIGTFLAGRVDPDVSGGNPGFPDGSGPDWPAVLFRPACPGQSSGWT